MDRMRTFHEDRTRRGKSREGTGRRHETKEAGNTCLPGTTITQNTRHLIPCHEDLNACGDDIPEDQRPERLPEHARPGRECFENLVHSTTPFSLCCLICKPVEKTSLRGAKRRALFSRSDRP